MTRQIPQILLTAGLVLLFISCAQVGSLSGGARDVTPPRLLLAEPPQQSLNFNHEEIILKFDEFIQLKDLSNQLIISPRLKTEPEITVKGRQLLIRIKKEELRPNTTYRLFFGNAVADMHESNPLKDFDYTFSTGAHIDTLSLSGTLTEAFTNKPAGGFVVGLYTGASQLSDSLPFTTMPDYMAKSAPDGSFRLKNLPEGKYEVYAFSDKNKNLLYDGESEQVAILKSAFELSSDSNISMRTFQEESPKGFVKKTYSPYYGFSLLIMNKRGVFSISPLKEKERILLSETNPATEKDTVTLYYRHVRDTLGIALTHQSSGRSDTIYLKLPKQNLQKRPRHGYENNLKAGKLLPGEKLSIRFPVWMDTVFADLRRVSISSKSDSSVKTIPVQGRWTNVSTFEFLNTFKDGNAYQVKIDTAAFYDVYRINNDSSRINFQVQSKTEFGELRLKILFYKKQSYLVQLLNEKSEPVKEKKISLSLSGSNAETVDFTGLLPGIYQLKVVFDDDANGKWTSGSVLRRSLPEKVIVHSKQLKILPDWEVEEQVEIKE